MKPYLKSKGRWPLKVEGLRESYWDDDKQETEVIKNDETIKIKPRNKQRDNDALILLHAALDELEAQNGKTPSPSELVAFILSGNFKHPNIQEWFNAEEGSLIDNRKLLLTDGVRLDKKGIIRRYQETIYK
jgi:hypothetical protein